MAGWVRKAKADRRVSDAYRDEESFWIMLAPGYFEPCEGTHQISEGSLGEVWNKLKGVKPCLCDECIRILAGADK